MLWYHVIGLQPAQRVSARPTENPDMRTAMMRLDERSAAIPMAGAALALAVAALVSGCASRGGPRGPEDNPAIVAAVRAEVRVVRGETTYVTHGTSYELVALSTKDIAAVDSSLDQQAHMYGLVFGEPPANVVVTVSRVNPSQTSYGGPVAPPLPPGIATPVVELRLFDRNARSGERGGGLGGARGGRGGGGYGGMGGGGE
ncbi:MAG TPA: hypothetical protein VIJ16_00005, partial [Gemmatimonadaceae bacterium]